MYHTNGYDEEKNIFVVTYLHDDSSKKKINVANRRFWVRSPKSAKKEKNNHQIVQELRLGEKKIITLDIQFQFFYKTVLFYPGYYFADVSSGSFDKLFYLFSPLITKQDTTYQKLISPVLKP